MTQREKKLRSSSARAPRTFFTAVFLLMVTVAPGWAQIVHGTVVGKAAGEALGGAFVELLSEDGQVRATAVTDSAGTFVMEVQSPGLYRLKVNQIGYVSQRTELFELTLDMTFDVRLVISSQSLAEAAGDTFALEPVTVTGRSAAELERRPRGTRGDVMPREQIERHIAGAKHIGDVLTRARFPGLSVRQITLPTGFPGICIEIGRRRTGNQCRMVEVYLDGARIGRASEVIVDLNPAVVEEFELLSPAEAGALFGTGSANGVLLITTCATRC